MAAVTDRAGPLKEMLQGSNNKVNGDGREVDVGGKKRTVEKTYQKKTQLEHILLRPDTYIGSVEKVSETMWVYDTEEEKFLQREITYCPGLYKIFDEILVNAADNKQRDPKMDVIRIDIDPENNQISVYNNGHGIPVVMHKEEKMFVPTMIFGHLLTSSNYNDDDKKVTGGRNGYGAKLCNIFSTKFTVETANKEYKKNFKQTWGSNMSKASEPKIKEFSGEEFTRITFCPDLVKFKMDSLDADTVCLLSRRAYDIAASTMGVKVFLNGKKVPVKNFKDYVEMFIKNRSDDAGVPLKVIYEQPSPRWEVAITISDKGFQQMSFVNSIATTKGGRHVDYVTNMVVNSLTETLSKKNKSGVQIRPFQVKNHLWIFVNCLIENPTFDSQTKETMTLQQKNFGSKCTLSDKFIASVVKSGIVEAVMAWAKFKQQTQLEKKCAGKKTSKLKGIPKLEDANDAGTRFSSECTLILTEGDSAKTLAVAGLGVIGRDRYGVFPLRGKVLNTREATMKQMMENAEINHIIQIVGLQYKKKYESMDDIKSLRYGKLMIMTDQDQDGSHIKGLLINFIHHNWPSLLKLPFLEEFITPIVKASKAKEEHSFYSLPEFEEWKSNKDNWHTYKIKYYKGLGTSTSKEAKEYFSDMLRHRILFKYNGAQDDHSIVMAFSKKAIEQRKEWLTAWMLECKRRRELGLPEVYLYEKDTKSVNYSDFINKELVLFSNADNERSIPCLVDGFKPGQRKVTFTCIKRNDKREVKVAQLAGSIAEHTAYHHGEVSLMSTIINLAQNYVGSNNINLLQPIGQFGTRLMGGKDSASPRYIFTKLSPLARAIFHPHDDALLKYLKEDNQKIEPEWYMPVIPMVLINGSEGIGTGWSTKIPNYNPREIIENLKRMIRGEDPVDMVPWFKNFRGTIEQLDATRYLCNGEVSRLQHNQYEITELPIRTWTQSYKESVLETLLGNEKTPPVISDYREYNTDTTVRFVVTLPENKVDHVEEEGPHKVFKLQSSMSINSMAMRKTSTEIRYPRLLKVGARNRKDPHGRIVGTPENVTAASHMVRMQLKPHNKITMEMDVSWTHHSHIIGKAGNTIQPVVRRTGVSIHFPNGNKNNEIRKSNRVSINSRGEELGGLEDARASIRQLTPLIFTFSLNANAKKIMFSTEPVRLVQHTQLMYNVQVELSVTGGAEPMLLVSVRGSELDVARVKEATFTLLQSLCGLIASHLTVQMKIEVSPQHHSFVLGRNNETIKRIMQVTSTNIIFPDINDANLAPLQKSTIIIAGAIDNVYAARQNIVGALPLVLMFETGSNGVSVEEIAQLMQNFNLSIIPKAARTDGRRAVVIKGAERDAALIYEAWKLVTGSDKSIPVGKIPPSYFISSTPLPSNSLFIGGGSSQGWVGGHHPRTSSTSLSRHPFSHKLPSPLTPALPPPTPTFPPHNASGYNPVSPMIGGGIWGGSSSAPPHQQGAGTSFPFPAPSSMLYGTQGNSSMMGGGNSSGGSYFSSGSLANLAALSSLNSSSRNSPTYFNTAHHFFGGSHHHQQQQQQQQMQQQRVSNMFSSNHGNDYMLGSVSDAPMSVSHSIAATSNINTNTANMLNNNTTSNNSYMLPLPTASSVSDHNTVLAGHTRQQQQQQQQQLQQQYRQYPQQEDVSAQRQSQASPCITDDLNRVLSTLLL